jgi:hypothetical protein
LGVLTSSAHAIVTTERGASILAFPKVLATEGADTIIQITNTSNNMVHARCFYVNAAPDSFGVPQWNVTDFQIWLTKQQPTSWQASTGRFVNQNDLCENVDGGDLDNLFEPDVDCAQAGLDPGAIPPLPLTFTGELKCVEVDPSGNPIGGNHLKGEATIKSASAGGYDTAKYNALGILGTEIAGETGDELLLNQPSDTEDVIGQYNACPNQLIVNHLSDLSIDPAVAAAGQGGLCVEEASGGATSTMASAPGCANDSDCGEGETCEGGAAVTLDETGNVVALQSANLTELTLIPCSQNFEDPFTSVPANAVTVQMVTYNEFEQRLSFSTTVECWKKFFMFQLDSPFDPESSQFSYNVQGTLGLTTVISPLEEEGGVLGVAGIVRADSNGVMARTLMNIHMIGDKWSATGGQITDRIILSGQ